MLHSARPLCLQQKDLELPRIVLCTERDAEEGDVTRMGDAHWEMRRPPPAASECSGQFGPLLIVLLLVTLFFP